jgi:hypothetical protein
VNKYTEGWAAGLVDLKRDMEANVEKVFEIYIRATPEQLWRAITDPGIRGALSVRCARRVRLDAGVLLPGDTPERAEAADRGRES